MSNLEKQKTELSDIVFDREKFKTTAVFQETINLKPPQSWVKDHPFIKNYKYLPIERVEYLLRSIFQYWEWKVIDYRVIANAIAVHGRLRVQHPVSGEWLEYDGLGAVDIQLKSGSNPTDFSAIMSGAIQKNLPSAESFALKDASEKIGDIFGGSLNRKDEIGFRSPYSKWDTNND